MPISQLIDPPPWTSIPHIVHGLGGARSEVICGYLACDDRLFDPRMGVFPPVFVVTPPEGPVRSWVRASSDLVLQQTSQVTDDRIAAPTDIPQLLLREVLKLHLANAPATDTGWLAALHDPVVAPALAAIHGDPGRKWTLADLAREATVSSTVLDERFRSVLGLAPIRYLTGWRMHVAEDLLRTTTLPVAAIAPRVGYESEEAFSRAFKRDHGRRPASGASRADHSRSPPSEPWRASVRSQGGDMTHVRLAGRCIARLADPRREVVVGRCWLLSWRGTTRRSRWAPTRWRRPGSWPTPGCPG